MFHLMNLRTAVVFAVRAGMVGLISFSIAFHRLEAYSRRELIPFFSGSVPAGDSGSEEQSAYALIGNTVNVASRIQGLTRELGCDILVSQETVEGLTDSFPMVREPPRFVKGYSKSIVVYRVLDRAAP